MDAVARVSTMAPATRATEAQSRARDRPAVVSMLMGSALPVPDVSSARRHESSGTDAVSLCQIPAPRLQATGPRLRPRGELPYERLGKAGVVLRTVGELGGDPHEAMRRRRPRHHGHLDPPAAAQPIG